MSVRKKVNFSLLVAFDALLSERHVTKAGQKIGISQPAMSNLLNQLRKEFGDLLFIRSGAQMVPTKKAQNLAPKIRDVLEQIDDVFLDQRFDPKTTKRTFRLGLSEYAQSLVLPKLTKLIAVEAPHIRLDLKKQKSFGDSRLFEDGSIDMGVGTINHPTAAVQVEELVHVPMMVVMNRKHPLARKSQITMSDYLEYQHVRSQDNNDPTMSLVEKSLRKGSYERDVAVYTDSPIASLYALSSTNYLATKPRSIVKPFIEPLDLVMKAIPFKVAELNPQLVWHKKSDSDQGHKWFRDVIARAVAI